MRLPKNFRLLGWGLSLFGLVALPSLPALAQQATRLTVSPVTFELSADPGDTLTNQVKVTNQSEGELQLETRVENISGTGDQGQVQLTAEETSFALSEWVKPDVTKFTLPAKETRIINFTIKVPANAEPGGHYGSLLVGTIASTTSSTGVGFGQKIGTLLLVKVSGQAKESAVIKSIQPKPYDGEWDEKATADGKLKVLIPKSDSIPNTEAQSYFEQGPIAFDLVFNNTGNVHVKPNGFVVIRNIFNKKIAELPIDPRNVFPGNDRQISVIWPAKKLWGVYYRAEVTAVYGASNEPITASASLWGFPKTVAIAIGIAALLLLVLRKRLGQAVRILIKGT